MFKKPLWEIVCTRINAVCFYTSLSVMLGKYLQQTIQQTTFSDAFFLGALRDNIFEKVNNKGVDQTASHLIMICHVC